MMPNFANRPTRIKNQNYSWYHLEHNNDNKAHFIVNINLSCLTPKHVYNVWLIDAMISWSSKLDGLYVIIINLSVFYLIDNRTSYSLEHGVQCIMILNFPMLIWFKREMLKRTKWGKWSHDLCHIFLLTFSPYKLLKSSPAISKMTLHSWYTLSIKT